MRVEDAVRIRHVIEAAQSIVEFVAGRERLEIQAEMPNGAPDNIVRTVTENNRTLKFSDQGFERE